ncbi:hypothetical protein ADM90_19365 [Lysinibacillus macroides]|uniref:Phage head morphogenesis protein n=2 Tax=Lysinibacillus macroides TaxID=33935 RepID=A0A0M9DIT6_9BACI|nr:hypothetical protein ADM90_19365 [Lysinibacillus macroides]
MKPRNYWRKRFELLEQAQHERSIFYYDDLVKAYTHTMDDLEKDILKWYSRFAKNNEITLDEAKRLLKSDELKEFKWNVQEYIKYGEQNAINQQWMKQLENASSRVHISRLESLQMQIQQHIEKLYGGQIEGFERFIKDQYQAQYYHTAFEVQTAFNVGFTMQKLDERLLEKVISKPWTADGMTFSRRLWRDKNILIDTLHKELTRTVATGKHPETIVNVLHQKLGSTNTKYQIRRLVMTEAAFFSAAAQREAYNDLDVERYEIIATLDFKTSTICREMDGKVFKQKDFMPGVTANPFHPHCRSTTAPYFVDDYSQRVARDLDGQTYYVPSNMKYEEWYQTQVEKYGADKIAITKKIQVNKSKDKQQYDNYKKTLGQNAPKSFEEFKDIKYSKGNEWNKLQDNYYVKSNLRDGTFGTRVNPEKQAPHMDSTRTEGKSYFFDTENVQKILDQYAGTGIVERDRHGNRTVKEVIVLDRIIGVAVSNNGAYETNKVKIHHSKKRTHLVPIRPD